MKKLKTIYFGNSCIALLLIVLTIACTQQKPAPLLQKSIVRIEQMPDLPQPLSIIDWGEKARQFDSLVFDFEATTPFAPYIWWDTNHRNFPQNTYGIYTAIGDARQGSSKNGGEFHEALVTLPALLSAGLIGIDKTNQNGYNYVELAQNYFNRDNGWNIVMNNTHPDMAHLGGGYGRDWWYDVYPNVLYYSVAALFPHVQRNDEIMRSVANKFYQADSILNGCYDYSYFDYGRMKPMRNNIPFQQDAAGGHAWVLYSAYKKFGDTKYLQGAISACKALDNQKESRFYEILLPFGAYTAARLNAEQGQNFDVEKILNHIFDGCQSTDGRYGWGVIAEKWGDYDVYRLQGSITDGGGYAFLMNSVVMAWPLLPMVKYDPQYARAIAKYLLNAVNAARLFYPDQMDEQHQWLSNKKDITKGIIAYEGLRKHDDYGKPELKGITPVALGDGPKWAPGQPEESMFSLYSSAVAGIYGAIVNKTDIEGILRLNCNATDFYGDNDFPVYLIYNPYLENREINYSIDTASDLFDILSRNYICRNGEGAVKLEIPAHTALLIAELPSMSKIKFSNHKIWCNDKIVSWK